MAKFVKFPTGPYSGPAPEANSVEGQMLKYLQGKYGTEPVDQFDLMTELNLHQKDDVVLKGGSVRPLSQLFGFKIPGWVKAGYAERVAAKVLEPKSPGKIAAMEAHIKELEAKLFEKGLDYTPFTWETKKAA